MTSIFEHGTGRAREVVVYEELMKIRLDIAPGTETVQDYAHALASHEAPHLTQLERVVTALHPEQSQPMG